MPFDGQATDARLHRRILIEALRAPLPDYYTWDFNVVHNGYSTAGMHLCGTEGCALGLAMEIWPERSGEILEDEDAAEFFGMSEEAVGKIFYNADLDGDQFYPKGEITPAMVADALEREPYVG